jgi:hypothetical protein
MTTATIRHVIAAGPPTKTAMTSHPLISGPARGALPLPRSLRSWLVDVAHGIHGLAVLTDLEVTEKIPIETMNEMATAWGVDLEAEAAQDGGGHSRSSGDDTEALEPVAGRELDREFLTA